MFNSFIKKKKKERNSLLLQVITDINPILILGKVFCFLFLLINKANFLTKQSLIYKIFFFTSFVDLFWCAYERSIRA